MPKLKNNNYPLDKLMLARRKAGFKQEDAARLLGISESTVRHHENGQSSVTIGMLRCYAELYGIEDYRDMLPSPKELSRHSIKR